MLTRRRKLGSAARTAAVTAALTTAMSLGATAANAYEAQNGWVASDYVTGFTPGPNSRGEAERGAGPVGLVFDGSGNLIVGATGSDSLHKVAPGGGTASGTKIRDGYGDVGGLAFDKSGRLYMTRPSQHDVIEVNPASGDIIRVVATGLACPVGLATDPISGDLFVSNVFCPGGGIFRISNFQTGSGTLKRYAGSQDADGLTFAPDGTLYAAGGTKLIRITGTNTSNPGTASTVADVPNIDGIVYAPRTERDDEYFVAVRTDGEIDRVDLDGRLTPVVTGGSRGDLVTVGPDRCIYADLQDRVVKLGPSSGACYFTAPVQPGFPAGDTPSGGGVLGERAASRVVDTAVTAKAAKKVRRGSRFTVTLRVTNKSATVAHTVVVTNRLPKGTKFVSARSGAGVSCKRSGSKLSCRKASLSGGGSFTTKIVLRSKSGSSYTDRASVKSNDLDPVPGNNKAKTRTKVKGSTSVLGVQRRGGPLPRTTG